MTSTDDRRARAVCRLSPSHAIAVRLLDDGASTERMARLLGIEEAAVGPLLQVAQAKLNELLRDSESVSPSS